MHGGGLVVVALGLPQQSLRLGDQAVDRLEVVLRHHAETAHPTAA